jgi:hypothetical protein
LNKAVIRSKLKSAFSKLKKCSGGHDHNLPKNSNSGVEGEGVSRPPSSIPEIELESQKVSHPAQIEREIVLTDSVEESQTAVKIQLIDRTYSGVNPLVSGGSLYDNESREERERREAIKVQVLSRSRPVTGKPISNVSHPHEDPAGELIVERARQLELERKQTMHTTSVFNGGDIVPKREEIRAVSVSEIPELALQLKYQELMKEGKLPVIADNDLKPKIGGLKISTSQ